MQKGDSEISACGHATYGVRHAEALLSALVAIGLAASTAVASQPAPASFLSSPAAQPAPASSLSSPAAQPAPASSLSSPAAQPAPASFLSSPAAPRQLEGAALQAAPFGRIVLAAGAAPKSLNYYLENSTFAAQICSMLYESLLSRDPESGEYSRGLAGSWTISDDGLDFTFELDPAARWSDGVPVTADDVRWTFDAVMAPSNMTGAAKVALSSFDPPEVLSPRAVRFHAREPHWRNLGAAGGMLVLPRHAFADRDFNSLNFALDVVSGPYALGEHRENVSLELERRRDWWAGDRPENAGHWNFARVKWRFFASRENAWEAFRKGLVDVFAVYTASTWVLETSGERFDKNWIVRREIRNRKPIGFQGFALNMRRPPLDDVRVRRALAHLLDRESFNKALMFGQYFLHRSYWEDLYDGEHPCTNELLRYDPPRARELLAEAGWSRDAATGRLRDRDGREFTLRFLSNSPSTDKFLARWRVALRDEAGIELKVERKDWAAWMRDMERYDFDATWCAWSAGLEKDPEGMWSSVHASEPGGNNVTGFSDPEVDRLVEAQKTVFSLERRNAIDREIDARLAAAVPYVLLWNADSTRLVWWNKFGMPSGVLSRFGGEDDVLWLWWPDQAAEDALADAMETGGALPPPPGVDDQPVP